MGGTQIYILKGVTEKKKGTHTVKACINSYAFTCVLKTNSTATESGELL